MRAHILKTALILLVIASAATLLYTKRYIPMHTYRTLTPKKGAMDRTVFGIGEISAEALYPLTAPTGGTLRTLTKDQGDRVTRGEVIAVIDPVDLPERIAATRALLEKARLQTRAAQEAYDALKAKVALAQSDFRRTRQLHRKKFASDAAYDRAKANLDSLTAQLQTSRTQIATAKAQERYTRKSLDALRRQLAHFTLTSPIDGYVLTRDAQVAQTLLPSQPIVTLVDPATLWARVYIDEHVSGALRKGQRATIILRSHPDRPLSGYVARIEPQSDPVTEERIVDVAFDDIPDPCYLKERVEATIVTARLHDVILLPLKALSRYDGHTGVWIDAGGKARFRPLRLLATDSRRAAVTGIDTDMSVLLPEAGKKPLAEGMRIYR